MASQLVPALWRLEQGYPIVCKKPVAVTRVEAERIAAAARTHNRIVMPCHQYRFNPVWVKVKDWLREGAIGRWHLAELAVHRQAADPGRVATGMPWRGTSGAGRGGGPPGPRNPLIHPPLRGAGPPPPGSA